MIRVLLVDDHAVVRAGYRRLIDAEPDMRVAADVGSGEEACDVVRGTPVDVAVVDLSLKVGSGLETIPRLLERLPTLKVLAFSMHDTVSHVSRALAAGACGYLTKDSQPETMIDAVRQAALGRRVLEPGLERALSRRSGDGAGAGRLAQLSDREFEILVAFAQGERIEAIATRMHLSAKTIANNLTIVRRKLAVQTDLDLLTIAVRGGLVRIDAGGAPPQPPPGAPVRRISPRCGS